MKYYIAYKFLDSNKDTLMESLGHVSSYIESLGNETFIFFRDAQNWGEISMSPIEIINRAFSEIEKSDVLFILLESAEKSEGMLLEIGYAKAKGKRIVLCAKKGIDLRFARALADEIMDIDSIMELRGNVDNKKEVFDSFDSPEALLRDLKKYHNITQ